MGEKKEIIVILKLLLFFLDAGCGNCLFLNNSILKLKKNSSTLFIKMLCKGFYVKEAAFFPYSPTADMKNSKRKQSDEMVKL